MCGVVLLADVTHVVWPVQVTTGAGRGEISCFSPDSRHILYSANYSRDKPITTHQDVWCVEFGVCVPQ
jgi:hypothetical protein